ncbi:hypothetical protein BC939DRAFT_479143 [Gamsiella multidivaricata]|uniref:uncharacterized protein n=1 Tax=Gamsiella multidivaricata TaxID=101098 RepID=UPI0022201E1B|nr:uncharacterized protein BC939DRAFT_479143 [Gamsiella multidivaricata]KAG0361081.1 hypothetical protein BGZ54_009249 [Gamsiella multidivaricata]KAI7819991.1 hypothetical protein BC939DRAFT_479143 [Gamsiella multidivaricata]
MDFLQNALKNMDQYSSAVADNHEDKEVMNNSIHNVAQNGVNPPEESDIQDAKAAHEKVYKHGASEGVSDEDLGKAAGVQAFKEYERSSSDESEGGGGGQGQLIQMAMAEAMKMFSGKGGSDKSAIIQSAIAMATKLFMGKSGAGGGGVSQLLAMLSGGGGGGSGGSGGSGGNGGSSGSGGSGEENKSESGGLGGMMSMLGEASKNPQVSEMFKKFM